MRNRSNNSPRRPDRFRWYTLRAVLEPDRSGWRAYVPGLESKGAAARGHSPVAALRNLQEVAQFVADDLFKDPSTPPDGVSVSDEPVVTVLVD